MRREANAHQSPQPFVVVGQEGLQQWVQGVGSMHDNIFAENKFHTGWNNSQENTKAYSLLNC